MLGEMIGEEKGKVTMHRVVRSRGKGHKVEVTIQTTGTLAGVEFRNLGTYYSTMRPGGFLYGEGQGLIMTKDGDSISWVGQGTGKLRPGGGVSYRGAVYYETNSTRLARLNGMAVAFEHESDANDNCSSKLWEWR